VSAFSTIQRRAEELGLNRRFRIAVAAVFSIAVLVAVVKVYTEAARMHRLAEVVPQLLAQANLKAKEAVAVELYEKGTLTVDGQVLGDEALLTRVKNLFTEAGAIERIAEGASLLLGTVRPEWLPGILVDEPWLVLAAGATLLGLLWFACLSGLSWSLIGVTLASAILWGTGMAFDRPSLAISLTAIPLFLFAFALVVRANLILLDRASPVFAIAGGVVREAMRQRVAVAFAVVALVTIPLLPQWIDPEQPLRYQVQTFLSRSLDVMYLVCAILTVFLGCATVAFEIRDRQAWLTLTKPVSRMSWLVGKWLGLVAVNAAILLVATVAMYAFLVQVRARPAQDLLDALAVDDEVLVARVGGFPQFTRLGGEELQQAVENAIKSDPNIRADIADGTRTEIDIKKQLAKTLVDENLKFQRSIGPGSDRVYRFSGLGKSVEDRPNLTLRYKFYAGESDPNATYPVIFVFGTGEAQSWTDRSFIAAQANVIAVPGSCVAPDGTLEVRVINAGFRPDAREGENPYYPGASSIAFDPDGLELLYRVGGFGDNLVRAQLMNLLKLSFLGMLAVTSASILSFPVACLVVFTLLAAGSIGPFLATSVSEYRIRTESPVLKGVEFVIKLVAGATEFSVRAFANARANGPLVEGRLVSWTDLGRTFVLIGVAWSGVLLILGVAAFRRKELAIYSGQGG
jgi:hypothetical protein